MKVAAMQNGPRMLSLPTPLPSPHCTLPVLPSVFDPLFDVAGFLCKKQKVKRNTGPTGMGRSPGL
eukprot:scaffold40068_cov32-Attheya_sp.AAC.3